MQIDSIEIFHVILPWKSPHDMAGRPSLGLETVLARINGGGISGWGEASPGNAPLASGEWAAGVFCCLRDWLAPAALAATTTLDEQLDSFRGNRFAKAALDTAWWDLTARSQNRPLHELLGGCRSSVEVGPTFDQMESIEQLLGKIGQAVDEGYARVKLKFRPGWDVEMLRVVRQEFPALTTHIDCEGSLGLQHMTILSRLDDFFLAMIEQPLPADDLVGHAMVQDSIRTPICLDESVTTPAQAEMALELHSCKSINLKPGRVGGLTAAVAIHDACHEQGISCWVGAMPQSAIGARLGLALAAKANCTYPADRFPSEDMLAADLADPLPPARDADGVRRVPLWSGPGIGVEPDMGLLKKFCLQHVKIG
jgi:O-succinylbenzoate synthase